jgi:hypothetical protein
MVSASSPIVDDVVSQHVEELTLLWSQRTDLVGAPHAGLRHLQRWDERRAAHLDGIVVAGDAACEVAPI